VLRAPVESEQYVSLAFGQAATKAGVARSMGPRGDCWDNAVAESFFATLKKELVHRRSWPSRQELRREVFDYIEIFYNATRRHSTLGMLSPARYEEEIITLEQLNNDNKQLTPRVYRTGGSPGRHLSRGDGGCPVFCVGGFWLVG
jgi:hypothetical protein